MHCGHVTSQALEMAMKAKHRPGSVVFLAVVTAFLTVAIPVFAYQYPLSSTDIRNAYLLGTRKDSVTADFFSRYRHNLPMPDKGPHVADIMVETPYAQVVDRGQSDRNPDSQQAEIDLANNKFAFLVRVGVDTTDTYPGPPPSNPTAHHFPPPDFDRDFDIQVFQRDKKIEATGSHVELLYSESVANVYQISGAIIELKFDIDKVDPDQELTVKVHTLDDQNIETDFDLGSLK
jgi:hypothetical protein